MVKGVDMVYKVGGGGGGGGFVTTACEACEKNYPIMSRTLKISHFQLLYLKFLAHF